MLEALRGELQTAKVAFHRAEKKASVAEERLARGAALGTGEGEAAINMEYLKHVVLSYAKSASIKERRSLLPVIARILRFQPDELAAAVDALERSAQPAAVAKNLLGGLF